MKKDQELRQFVIDELEFEPSVDASRIGVAVGDGIVTLSGHVSTYDQKCTAERAALRVKGIRGIAQEIHVTYPGLPQTDDDQIAKRALDIIAWNVAIPQETIQVKVQEGWVTLTGSVPWQFQRDAATSSVRRLSGVLGVNNLITIAPHVHASDVKATIQAALHRNADVDAAAIRVDVDGSNKITLTGKVKSWAERTAAERAAWSIAGVDSVEDRLSIG
ncbi:BON domain-containing protein [Bordetella sp. FB-8]|uniref:BON domain-containing protein n=1 Tax=Bordetella sp. FB-8 TaxID=1159870 RepID=UPI00037E598C|nr:BON domain-containing protein [Bordetella sp. FB-8]